MRPCYSSSGMRFAPRWGRPMLLALGMVLAPSLRAGTVESIDNPTELRGKVSLDATALHIDGSSQSPNLPDVLAAIFSDVAPVTQFFSSQTQPDHLPAGWKGVDIGSNASPGSFTYSKGLLTLSSHTREKIDYSDQSENSYFVGQPWTGNGQWTAHVKSVDPTEAHASVGVCLRQSFDAQKGVVYEMSVSGLEGGVFRRYKDGGNYGRGTPLGAPVWLRLTRTGIDLSASTSNDGLAWTVVNQTHDSLGPDEWAGLYSPYGAKTPGVFQLDNITYCPPPSLSEALPAGVVLRSGSFIAGLIGNFDLTSPSAQADLDRAGKTVRVAADKITAINFFSTPCPQFAQHGDQSGLLLKNGDFVPGDVQAVQGGDPDIVRLSSLELGITEMGARFGESGNAAVFLHPLQLQPANYEIRLTDGSILRANEFQLSATQVIIHEISGIDVLVDASEIAQFRAGTARVQNLLALAWTTATGTPPPAAKTPAAPVDPTAPPIAPPLPALESWQGNGQEQMILVPAGTSVTFPLTESFRAFSLHIALAPGASADAQASVQILADGRELGTTPPMKVEDAPRLVEAAVHAPKTLTFTAVSATPGARILIIDPVAVR